MLLVGRQHQLTGLRAELDEAALSKLVEEDGQVEETKAKDDDSDRVCPDASSCT